LSFPQSGVILPQWRSSTRTKNDIEVCFTFDVDDEGNLLVIVTLMRTT
jgi:hypothetical protein